MNMNYYDMLNRVAFGNQMIKLAQEAPDPNAVTYRPKDLFGNVSTIPVTRDPSKKMTEEERAKFYNFNQLKPEIAMDPNTGKTEAQKRQEIEERIAAKEAEPKAVSAAEPEKAPEPELSSWESYQRDYKLGPWAEKAQEPPPEIKEPKKERIASDDKDPMKGVRSLIAGIGGFANGMAGITKSISDTRNEAEQVADSIKKTYEDYKKEHEKLDIHNEAAKAMAGGE